MGTVLGATGACIALYSVPAVLVQDAVVVLLLDGEVVALRMLPATLDAVFKMRLSIQGGQIE